MPYLTTYSFDSNGTNDWTNPGPYPPPFPNSGPLPQSSPFHSATVQFSGTASPQPWLGVGRAVSVIRDDTESLHVLSDTNFANADSVLTFVKQRFEGKPNAFFRPPILTSYAFGGSIQGPGRAIGGLPSVPAQYLNKILFTVNVPFHLNTPPGVAAVNGYIVYYIDISLQGGHAAATVLGVAHPWAFESGLVGAGQDEINSGLDGTVKDTTGLVQEFLNLALGKIPGTYSYVYLLPGIVTHQGTSPVTGDASRDITLALAPNLLHGPIIKPIG